MGNENTIEELEAIIAGAGDPAEKAAALMIIGNLNFGKANYQAAREHFLQALQLFESAGAQKGMSNSLSNLGLVCGELGDYNRALEYLQAALRIREQLNEPEAIANSLNNIGNIHLYQGKYSAALEYYYKCWYLIEQSGPSASWSRPLSNLAGSALYNIGLIHHTQNDLPTALEFLNQSLAIREKNNDLYGSAFCYAHLGQIHQVAHDYSLAMEFFLKALETHEGLGNKTGISNSLVNIGSVYEEQQQHPLALEYYQKALAMYQQAGDKRGISSSLHRIGSLNKKIGALHPAEQHLLLALEVAIEIGHQQYHRETLKMLYEIKKEQKDAVAALDYHERYIIVKDEMTNTETSKQIANLKVGYDLELNEKERKLIEGILHNILPKPIANRIKEGEDEIIEKHEQASVLFADIVGFTTWSQQMEVKELAQHLNRIFHLFDGLATEHGVEKIKTIGDAYMCVAGLPEPCDDHAERIAKMALAMNRKLSELYPNGEIRLRTGIHTGEVIAGVIGKNKYAYDLWGDTVNTASRMESHSLPERIQVTEEFKNLLEGKFSFEERGEIEVKGKGKMRTWFLVAQS